MEPNGEESKEFSTTKTEKKLPNRVYEANISWEDIGGLEDVKRELREIIQCLVQPPEQFLKYGMSPSKGILLYGPPGCGKSLLAKAFANECQFNFISIRGSELVNISGEPEANIREIFDKVRSAAPCVLFLSEFDAISDRNSEFAGGGAVDRAINQFLTELDGTNPKKKIFIIGSSHRPEMIDSTLFRPGRLDRLIYVPLPDTPSRLKILQIVLKNCLLSKEVDLDLLANKTSGYSGDDLTDICFRACKLAIREDIEKDERSQEPRKDEEEESFHIPEIRRDHFEESMKVRHCMNDSNLLKYEMFAQSHAFGISEFNFPDQPNCDPLSRFSDGEDDDLYS